MNKRQRVIVQGNAYWLSFKSTQDLVNQVVAMVEEGAVKGIKLSDYLWRWFETYKRPMLKRNTANNYRGMIRNHIIPYIGSKPVSQIGVEDVQRIMSTLKAASTAKQVKSIINLVMDAAIAYEIYEHPNPTRDKRICMPTQKDERNPLDREALAALLKCLPELPFESARLLVMLIMTGCRRGEALAARWEDIDWQRKTIHFQRVLRFRNNAPEISGKMKTPSANRTVALWEPYLMYLGEPKEQGYIIERNGEPMTEQQYRKLWGRIMEELKRMGIKGSFTAHQLRHTYATVAANSGEVPIKVLQGMMGHANFQTTMNIYADLDKYRMEESSRLLGEKYVSLTAKFAENLKQGRGGTP